MRFYIILAGIGLLVLGLIIGAAASGQPFFDGVETAPLIAGQPANASPTEYSAAESAPEPLADSAAPPNTSVQAARQEARQTAVELMARLDQIRAEVGTNESGAYFIAQEQNEPDPAALQDEPDLADDEISTARQLAQDLMASAQNLIDVLNRAQPAAEPAQNNPPENSGLSGQLQSLIAQISSADEQEAEEKAAAEWMPSRPDCDAEPAPGVNWSGCDKSGIELTGANLQWANLMDTDFSGAVISGTDMSGAHMAMANFSNAELESVLMYKSILKEANFSGASLVFVDLSYSILVKADFSNALLENIRALHSKFIEADFTSADMAYNDFSYSDLSQSSFSGTSIGNTFFQYSILNDTDMNGAGIDFVDFQGAKIPGLDLSDTTMEFILFRTAHGTPTSSVDLTIGEFVCPDGTYEAGPLTSSAANLCIWQEKPQHTQPPTPPVDPDCAADPAPGINWSGCDKSNISLIGVDLSGANLNGTNFSGAMIYMSDLHVANLSGADLSNTLITLSNFQHANLSEADLSGSGIEQSDFSLADFTLADLSNASLAEVLLRHANLTGATLSGVILQNSFASYANLNEAIADAIQIGLTWLPGANLTATNFSNSPNIDNVDMSIAQIEGLDLSAVLLNSSNWLKGANGIPTSSEDVTNNETLICPAGDAVFGPQTTDAASLCTWKPCWAGIIDGDFETQNPAWIIPQTEYPAAFSMDQAYSPDWSVRTGITEPGDNTYSFSSVRQKVTIPAGTFPAILTFYLYPQTSDPINMLIPTTLEEAESAGAANALMGGYGARFGDAQWVIILDEHGRELLRPISMRSNTQEWEQFEVDLSHLVDPHHDRTIEVYFGTFNNGRDGVTSMYVDDVYLGSCPGVPAPPPPPPPPQICSDIILNGGFETEADWLLPLTTFPAQYSTAQFNNGAQSMLTGIGEVNGNVASFSSALQRVTIPEDATEANLEFYLYPQVLEKEDNNWLVPESMEEILSPPYLGMIYRDIQWVLLLNQHGQQIAKLVSMHNDDQTWEPYTFDLLPYRGHTLLLYFSTYNNGKGAFTSMYVDDVSLNVCAPETRDPTMALSPLELGQ